MPDQHEHQKSSQVHFSPNSAGGATSFDELAKGLASGTLSRGKALRLLGAALIGGAFASMPGVAWAAKGGNSECVRCCKETFGPGRERGQCISAGARGDCPVTCDGNGGVECSADFDPCGDVCCEFNTRECVTIDGRPHCVCEVGKTECGGPTHRCCFSDEVCVNGECTCAPEYTLCGNEAKDEFLCCSEGQFCCKDPVEGGCCDTPCCKGVCCLPGQTCVNGQCTCTQGFTCGNECCTDPSLCCGGSCCKPALGEICHPEFDFCTTKRECPPGVECCPPGSDCGTRFLCTPAGECCDGTVMISGECCPAEMSYCSGVTCDEFGNCLFCENCCPPPICDEFGNCRSTCATVVTDYPTPPTCTCVTA
jgi:hypothetical protein